tara:strand:+ start:65 stop:445 length:381 start_codon:yes stop_codon:yes gene_type:complete
MALSNLDKDNLYRLFNMININDTKNQKLIDSVKSNNTTYAKLQLITKQIENLKQEAIEIINENEITNSYNNIECNFRKTPGNYYYIYEKNNKQFLSMISPDEWNTYEKFIKKVYLDFDYNFYNVFS